VPYYDFKTRLKEKLGLAFGTDYAAIYQVATSSPGRNEGASSTWRFFGSWTLLGRDTGGTGSLVFKVENDRRLGGGISAAELGPEIGSLLATAHGYGDDEWGLSNLFWQQRLFERRFVLVAGQVDPSDYTNTSGSFNRLTAFTNAAFSSSPTIPMPSPGLGGGAAVFLPENLYLVASVSDANADSTEPFQHVFRDGELFKHVEVGWFGSYEKRRVNNIHLTGWHVDKREAAGVPKGWGIAFSSTWTFERWTSFLRAGYSHGDATEVEGLVSLGVSARLRRSDQLGLAFSWSRPAAGGLRDQYTSELFYRLQLGNNVAVTPDIQLLFDPALDDRKSVIAVFGIRVRVAF
jgi:porin